MKYESDYKDKEIQRLKEENNLKLEITELKMQLAQKETQVKEMEKEKQVRQCEVKMEQQARQHEEEKAQLASKAEEEKEKLKKEMELQHVQSEQKLQEVVAELQRLSSISSTSSNEMSLSRSNTGLSTYAGSSGADKDDNNGINTTTKGLVQLKISNSDKED